LKQLRNTAETCSNSATPAANHLQVLATPSRWRFSNQTPLAVRILVRAEAGANRKAQDITVGDERGE